MLVTITEFLFIKFNPNANFTSLCTPSVSDMVLKWYNNNQHCIYPWAQNFSSVKQSGFYISAQQIQLISPIQIREIQVESLTATDHSQFIATIIFIYNDHSNHELNYQIHNDYQDYFKHTPVLSVQISDFHL